MINEIGNIFLSISATLSLCMFSVIFFRKSLATNIRFNFCKFFSISTSILITLSFLILAYAFLIDDFSLRYVANNSNIDLENIYKFSAVWGAHEGSILLWVLVMSIWCSLIILLSKNMPKTIIVDMISVMGLLLLFFLVFILFSSNPFDRVFPVPLNGRDLNPLLQDPGLIIHPPMLYIGYVGLSVSFSFAVGALITGQINKEWAQQMMPWITIAWSALTIGIALGSWWAYYELGWGGWWFWDPVENASFMPWLIATALLHSVRVLEKKLVLINWIILLSILAFSFSLLGTFIVRSGLLTSVHAFASDPSRGVFILIILAIAIGGPLILYALKSSSFKEHKVQFNLMSKESAILINNLFLTTATATVLIGTLYPLFLDAFNGNKISIGPAYYNATFAPIMAPVVFLMAIAPLLNWNQTKNKNLSKKLIFLIIATFFGMICLYMIEQSSLFAVICGSLSIWLFSGVVTDIISKIKESKIKFNKLSQFFFFISKINLGIHFAHIGVAVFLAGVTGEQFFKTEYNGRKNIGDVFNVGNQSLEFKKIEMLDGPNYRSQTATFNLLNDGKVINKLKPEKRFYPTEKSQTTEAAILTSFLGDTYLVLGDGNKEIGWSIRVYFNPLVSWIWGGACLMALGGLVSILQNRKSRKIIN